MEKEYWMINQKLIKESLHISKSLYKGTHKQTRRKRFRNTNRMKQRITETKYSIE